MARRTHPLLAALAAAALLAACGGSGGSGSDGETAAALSAPAPSVAAVTVPAEPETVAAAATTAEAQSGATAPLDRPTGDPDAIALLDRIADPRPQRMEMRMTMGFAGASAEEAGLADVRTTVLMEGRVDGPRMRYRARLELPPGAPHIEPLEMRVDGEAAWVGIGDTWYVVDAASARAMASTGGADVRRLTVGALRDVHEGAATEVAGVPARRVLATVDAAAQMRAGAEYQQLLGLGAGGPPGTGDSMAAHALPATFEALVDAEGRVRRISMRAGVDFAAAMAELQPGALPDDAELEMWSEATSTFTPAGPLTVEHPVAPKTGLTLAEIMQRWGAGTFSV